MNSPANLKPDSAEAKRRKREELSKRVSRIKEELSEMPKPAVKEVPIPLGLQVKSAWQASSLMLLCAGGCYLLSVYGNNPDLWSHVMKVILSLFSVVALFLGLLSIWLLSHTLTLRKLSSGEYYAHWIIPAKQWQSICEAAKRDKPWIRSIASAAGLGTGLVFAAHAYADGNLYFATVTAHFSFLGLFFLGIGFVLGRFCWKLSLLKDHIMNSREGQVLIGPPGVYMTGEFWSFEGATQWLHEISVSREQPNQLDITVATTSEHGTNYKTIAIPFAQEDQLKAKVICGLLKEKR